MRDIGGYTNMGDQVRIETTVVLVSWDLLYEMLAEKGYMPTGTVEDISQDEDGIRIEFKNR